MPDEILKSAKEKQLILFCGAGISTENKNVLPFNFYSEIKEELNIEKDQSFSALMSQFCSKTNGRRKLIQKIKSRFDYINSFSEIEGSATKFHRELAPLYMIDTIITTNWDDYFERYCNATPITTTKDFVFWNCCDRRVLKIHGSINNIGSIVATQEDYKECAKSLKTNIIGSTLKSLLATKTVIFIGFSFGDEDFKQILDYVVKEMKDYMPHIFVVTTDDTLQERVKYQNLTAIITDGTFFIHKLKSDLISEGYLLNPDIGQDIYYMYSLVQTKHEDLVKHIDYINCPQIIYCLSYQDGILHAFERFIQLESTGKYYEPSHISKVIKSYDYLLEQYQKSNLYWDVAYIEGYINALVYMLADDDAKKEFPKFYLPNATRELRTQKDLLDMILEVESINDHYRRYAREIVKDYTNDLVVHHTPVL
ncbi:hypothetical protein FDC22_02620 [Clostridium botulinum]|nr:SIR2 family protein [Clostridium botulinum]MBD5561621.1 SIR2 family protein [Clostridium botulinum]MBD5565290.1 SIR2 family protein [Clostridium botulinum]MBD5570706.1 SIR2 family protein [Clostridium botulinum]MBD5574774.1 SIR2 family protein [Clostridium botulinum]MBD5578202.1 SIR2 family protein [Clostridium botulinum]